MNKTKLEFLYSIAILIAIPLLLVVNTVLLVNNTRNSYNTELRRKADLVNLTLANAALPYLEDNDTAPLNRFLTKLDNESNTISNLLITRLNGNEVDIVARSDNSVSELEPAQQQHVKIAADSKENAIARLDDAVDTDGDRTTAWTIATPLVDNSGNLVAVALSSTSTSDADELISSTYTTSFIVLFISVIVAIALLLHHYRLASYSKLLAKQKEINQTMSDFLSVATHELKAPTSIIKGYISNVTDGTFGDISDKIKEQLNVALSQTDRLGSLVKDLLNVSRIEQGRVEYDIKEVDIAGIIDTIKSTYDPVAQDKGLKIEHKKLEFPVQVKADAGRVQEIFTNLIDNAVKYTPSGTVTISYQVEKDKLATKIRDTGPGITAEERERLFQRFYRVKNEHTKDISGTGLGLWIIKQYIEHMGGHIEVDSLVGSGTEFSVHLPLSTTTPKP